MSVPLAPTIGAWLVSMWLQTLLQGCGMLQAWLYFHWYKKDKWGIKAMVVFLLIIETCQSVLLFQITYFYLIEGFGNVPGLNLIYWQDSAQLFGTLLSAFVVHIYFAFCIYMLDKSRRFLPSVIVILSLVEIGAGLAETIITSQVTFTELGLPNRKISGCLRSVTAVLCDVIIAASLVIRLGTHKGNVKPTNNIIYKLMMIAINRGVLTATFTLLNLILYFAIPGTLWFLIGLTLSGKLYMNSALATLNVRQHLAKTSQFNQSIGVPLSEFSAPVDAESTGMQIVVITDQVSSKDPTDYQVRCIETLRKRWIYVAESVPRYKSPQSHV